MIGPRALDTSPVVQSYTLPPGKVAGGLPKWRALLGFVVLVVLLANLPKGGPQGVNADSFAGDSVSCTTQAATIATFSPAGFSWASIQFHLTMPSGGTVGGRWISSNGYQGGLDTWSGGTSGVVDLWLAQGTISQDTNGDGVPDGSVSNNYMQINFAQTSGTMSYVVQKLASYGGCFSVDHVIVIRTPSTGLPPSTPNASAPQASQSVAPTPSGGAPSWAPGSPVPSGWCAVYDERGGNAEGNLVPCATQPAAISGGGGTSHSCRISWPTSTCTAELGWSVPGATVSGTVTVDDSHARSECCSAPAGFNSWTAYEKRAPAHEDGTANGDYASFDSSSYPTHTDTWSYGPIASVNSTFLGAGFVDWCNGCGGYSATSDSYVDFTWVVSVDDPSASPSPSPSGVNPMPSGWPSFPPLPTFGAFPSFAWPSLPPFSWPSYPPFPSGGAVNICGPDPSGATPAIAACVSASGEPGTSFEAGIPDPSGAVSGFAALASNLAGKAPFGAVVQVTTALTGAFESPEGATWDPCVDVPYLSHDLPFCLDPDVAEAAVAFRPWMAAFVWLAVAVSLWRLARGTVGANDA